MEAVPLAWRPFSNDALPAKSAAVNVPRLAGFVLDDLDLAPALVKAPRRHGAWVRRQLLAEQVASTPTVPLYHYG